MRVKFTSRGWENYSCAWKFYRSSRNLHRILVENIFFLIVIIITHVIGITTACSFRKPEYFLINFSDGQQKRTVYTRVFFTYSCVNVYTRKRNRDRK